MYTITKILHIRFTIAIEEVCRTHKKNSPGILTRLVKLYEHVKIAFIN